MACDGPRVKFGWFSTGNDKKRPHSDTHHVFRTTLLVVHVRLCVVISLDILAGVLDEYSRREQTCSRAARVNDLIWPLSVRAYKEIDSGGDVSRTFKFTFGVRNITPEIASEDDAVQLVLVIFLS